MQEVATVIEPPRAGAAAAGETLATRLASWAQRMPDQPALVDGAARLTWRALDERVTAIASRIVARANPSPGRVVLLLRERASAIASMLAVGRSGHALVMLDPADPEDRMRFVTADAEPFVLLTEAGMAERALALAPSGCTIVDVGEAHAHPVRPMPRVDGDSIAHVCYTSGSTGQAKGVCQSHANQLVFSDTYARNIGVGIGDRGSLLYSLAFAAGLGAVARAIASGMTLCLYDVKRDGVAGLADWLDRERVTMLQTFPMVFREMVARIGAQRTFPHLRVLQLGGDSIFADDYAKFRSHTLPHCKLVHQLSSSEIGILAQNILRHDAMPPSPGTVIPVGRPIEGVRLEIRRDDGSLAEPGEDGEIVAISRHVSLGYWKRPELDARAFSPDPRDPRGRAYRSGDFGHIDGDGMLHFIGRVGSRVKIRGYTVDLAEVDAALVAWPDAAHAAVAAEADADDATLSRLIAYVEVREGARRDLQALMRFLCARLPRHMLPVEVRFLAALPRTPGGKLDRKRFAAEAVLAPQASGYSAPQDAIEEAVGRMFAGLLALERIGRDDDFFLVGGDSMMAADLQARIKDAFGVRVSGFHEDATVAGIAVSIRDALADTRPRARSMPMLVPLWRDGAATPLFMVHGRHGQAFVSAHFMRLLGDGQPVWAFQARGLDGESAPHATIEAMVDDYVAEVRSVRPNGPYFIGGLCVGCYIAAAMAQQLRTAGETVLPLLLLDPPNHVSARTQAHADPGHVAGKMRARRDAGRLHAPMEDPEFLAISVQTGAAFNEAIARYVPRPYDGPVYVLSSRHRMRTGESFDLRKVFTGRVKRYEVGQSHNDALDPRNPLFASTLKRCIGLIQDAQGGA
jgi:acyl-CoA synthetase (AMP-forming)/AMP-acid ligase II/thioesterase domain-containing protein